MARKRSEPRKPVGEASPTILDNGTVEWRLPNGRLHREDGPAVKRVSGYEAWFYDGQFHRDGGPALTADDGFQAWFKHGKYQMTHGYAPDGGPLRRAANEQRGPRFGAAQDKGEHNVARKQPPSTMDGAHSDTV